MTDLVDIDERPDLSFDFDGTVEKDDAGVARFFPAKPSKWLDTLSKALGSVVLVTVTRAKKKRSDAANRYLWGMVYEDLLTGLRGVAQDAGGKCPFANKDALHEAMKYRFLGLDVFTHRGVTVEFTSSTTKLTSAQFAAYVDQVKALGATWGIYIRNPGERVAA